MLARPWYPTAVTLALVPSVLKMALSTPDCCVSKLARYVPMEKPSSGVTAAIAVRVTLLAPPKKICGTCWVAVTITPVQGACSVGTWA